MESQTWLGWVSSLILLLTLSKQIHTQWKERSCRGVSKWLYLGQFAAETGFITYSFLLRNWVFLVTNSGLLLLNALGLALTLQQQGRRAHSPSSSPSAR